jgi:hypothetical protein
VIEGFPDGKLGKTAVFTLPLPVFRRTGRRKEPGEKAISASSRQVLLDQIVIPQRCDEHREKHHSMNFMQSNPDVGR